MRGPWLVAPLLAAGLAVIAACGAKPAEDPSFLLVELDAFAGDLGTPHAARVALSRDKAPVTSPFCVKLAKPGAATPASFVLRRDFGKDPRTRVTIVVTAFDALAGDAAVEDGRELVCPPTLPPPLGEAQEVSVDFCDKKAEKLVFHVGATCGCGGNGPIDGGAPDGGAHDGGVTDGGVMDAGTPDAGTPDAGACGCGPAQVCGAGLSPEGHSCFGGECCASDVSTACALLPAPGAPASSAR